MKILFMNDDGYDAIGIQTLYNEFAPYYDSYICAPLTHKSAFSHAINYYDSLELKKLTGKMKGFALDGTPADCARVAFQGLFKEKFDIVLSGINYGVNAAQDIFYSGTVGAARESTFHGVMAIALSLDIHDSDGHVITDEITQLFAYAAKITRKMIDNFPKEIFNYRGSLININFPSKMPAKGIKLTTVGLHNYETQLFHSSKNNKEYVKINTVDKSAHTGPGTDVYHLQQGYIVVTALHQGIIFDQILQDQLTFIENISTEIE